MMGAYVAQVRHVRYWRGRIHRWTTDYVYTGTLSGTLTTTDCQTIANLDDKLCYGSPTIYGGTYGCAIYDLSKKGSPIAQYTKFDYTTPASWTGYGGAGWSTTAAAADAGAETSLQVFWAGGVSKTGKRVVFRKWYHAVPVATAGPATGQVTAGDITSLTAAAQALVGPLGGKGLVLGSRTGRLAGQASVSAFYGNHQMVRGRRKTAKQVQGNAVLNFINNHTDLTLAKDLL